MAPYKHILNILTNVSLSEGHYSAANIWEIYRLDHNPRGYFRLITSTKLHWISGNKLLIYWNGKSGAVIRGSEYTLEKCYVNITQM